LRAVTRPKGDSTKFHRASGGGDVRGERVRSRHHHGRSADHRHCLSAAHHHGAEAGLDMIHVPYRGAGAALNDLIGRICAGLVPQHARIDRARSSRRSPCSPRASPWARACRALSSSSSSWFVAIVAASSVTSLATGKTECDCTAKNGCSSRRYPQIGLFRSDRGPRRPSAPCGAAGRSQPARCSASVHRPTSQPRA
jgi:hypothetical protein